MSGNDEPRGVPSAGTSLAAGDYVHLAATPGVVGVVVRISQSAGEPRVHVFHDGREHTYFARQLERHAPESSEQATAAEMKSRLAAHLVTRPSSSQIYSFDSGRIEYEPYQFRPVLKLIAADRPRLLIADDVGVGKTIEAGLIIKELQARQRLESILVVCPKPLVVEGKWRAELKRFDEDFAELDSATLRHCIEELRLEGRWPARYRKAILPYSLLDERFLLGSLEGRKKVRGLVGLEPPVAFDLVIVDEAHHVRNPSTWRHRAVEYLLGHAEAAVLISATPVQTSSSDLFQLLKLLRPDRFTDLDEFDRMREPNAAIARAETYARAGGADWVGDVKKELGAALSTSWGPVLRAEPTFLVLQELLESNDSSDRARVRAVRAIQSLNTFARLINRTRRRDIGAFTVRRPEAPAINFTVEQARLYDDVMNLAARIVASRGHGLSVEFLLSTFRRQASSSLNGLAPFIFDMLAGRLGDEEFSELDVDTASAAVNPSALAQFRAEIEAIAVRARGLVGDPKLDALLAIVGEKQALENNKLLVFSSFRHTLAYLYDTLNDRGVRVGLVHGGHDDDHRRLARSRFALDRSDPDAFDVLLSSEVGTEGLDNQFCDALVNYDIPWNPMRIEQRIGRIDRRGQLSESISIKNLVVSGTIDELVYSRCLERIGLFQASLGASEEILGELAEGIRSIALDLRLSDAQRAAKLQQLADNGLARIEEQAQLEEKEAALFGLEVQKEADDGVDRARSPWLASSVLAPLVGEYLVDRGISRGASLTAKGALTLRPRADSLKRLREDSKRLALADGSFAPWMAWLSEGGGPGRPVTFDPEVAAASGADLLSVTHPLVRSAALWKAADGELTVGLRAASTGDLPPGRYPFVVVGWDYLGVKPDFQLGVVSAKDAPEDSLLAALFAASDAAVSPSHEERDALAEQQFSRWEQRRDLHREATRALAEARRVSLEISHSAVVAQRQQQVETIEDPRIRVMRQSQLEGAHAEFEASIAELEAATMRCDLRMSVLVTGLLEVV